MRLRAMLMPTVAAVASILGVRARLPYDREGKGFHLRGLRQEVKANASCRTAGLQALRRRGMRRVRQEK